MGLWEPLFFWIFAFGALATSAAVILLRNPLYSALALIVDFFCFAGLYGLLSAHFLAVAQILVYGGAIMVLFLFIIMLLNIRGDDSRTIAFELHAIGAIVGAVAMFGFAAMVIANTVDMDAVEQGRSNYAEASAESDEPVALRTDSAIDGLYADVNETAVEQSYQEKLRAWRDGAARPSDGKYPQFDPERPFELPPSLEPDPEPEQVVPGRDGLYGTFKPVSIMLVNRFVVPFEMTAVLLLAAIVGAMILAKRRVA